MKKKIIKKLSLNKTTVADLNAASMGYVRGGAETFHGEACHDFITGGPNVTETCNTCAVTCNTCAATCETCRTNCGLDTCQFTCDDLITG